MPGKKYTKDFLSKNNSQDAAKDIIDMMRYFNPGSKTMPNKVFLSEKFGNCNPETAQKLKTESHDDLRFLEQFNGFSFWRSIFKNDEEIKNALTEFEKDYKESMKACKLSKGSNPSLGYYSNFLINSKPITHVVKYDVVMKDVNNILTTALVNVCTENKNYTNDLCRFFNKIDEIATDRKKEVIKKNAAASEFVNSLLKSIADSGEKSFRNSQFSATMYTSLREISNDLKGEYDITETRLDALKNVAQEYLSHKVKDGYNANAYQKISAADGILKMIEAYKKEDIDALTKLKQRDAKEVMSDSHTKELSRMDIIKYKEKASYKALLKEEIAKDKKNLGLTKKATNKETDKTVSMSK